MNVIYTTQTVKDGKVFLDLPPEFSGREVEIVVSLKSPISNVPKMSLRGILKGYAQPDLMSRESGIWGEVVGEKYGDR